MQAGFKSGSGAEDPGMISQHGKGEVFKAIKTHLSYKTIKYMFIYKNSKKGYKIPGDDRIVNKSTVCGGRNNGEENIGGVHCMKLTILELLLHIHNAPFTAKQSPRGKRAYKRCGGVMVGLAGGKLKDSTRFISGHDIHLILSDK